MTVLFAVPPDCGTVTVFAYPLPAESDTSKPGGAVAIILFVKPVPDTVNCCMFGLADGEPWQAEIGPVAALAVITGGIDAGFTVIVKVIGAPLQPVPADVKLPNESGPFPEGSYKSIYGSMGFINSKLAPLVAKIWVPSGLIETPIASDQGFEVMPAPAKSGIYTCCT
jgi:hypothetical protein